jgi:ribosome-associated protein
LTARPDSAEAAGAVMQTLSFELRGEFITLDRLLKATGLASSGGGAKAMVAEGRVQVDGRDELRKTAKIRAGQVVALTGVRVVVVAPHLDGGGMPADVAVP